MGEPVPRVGEKPADVAIAWMLQNKAITAPIIGPRTLEQLDGQLRSLEITLSDETNQKLNEYSPARRPRRKITPGKVLCVLGDSHLIRPPATFSLAGRRWPEAG